MLNIFVGSSSEASRVDTDIRRIIESYDGRPVNWRSQFQPGEFGLESLERVKSDVDAALLIATPDDRTWYRGADGFSPRDNILFELGLFMSELGRDRAAIIVVTDRDGNRAKLPSDLAGLNYLPYYEGREASNETLIKSWIDRLDAAGPFVDEFENPFEALSGEFAQLPTDWHDEIRNYLLDPFRSQSYAALRGEFELDVSQYYFSLFNSLSVASSEGLAVKAVSNLSHEIWDSDPFQVQYLERNLHAADQGVAIRRVFVINSSIDPKLWRTIELLMDGGIEVRVVTAREFAHFRQLDDMVLFTGQTARCYLSDQTLSSANRFGSGRLNLNVTYCRELESSFDALWTVSATPTVESVRTEQAPVAPPGDSLDLFDLESDVISCGEAAALKGIPLKNELKTMLAQTTAGLVAIHLRGDHEISWNKVKRILKVKQASLLSPEQLAELHLSPGTVSAVLDPVWSMPHLISKHVIALEFVSTNNGTRRQFYRFDPTVLLQSAQHIVDSFEKGARSKGADVNSAS